MATHRQPSAKDTGVSVLEDTALMQFSDARIPKMEKIIGRNYVPFGDERNDFPEYLLYLYNKSALHNAIVVGKCMYIIGKGFEVDSMANESQTWGEVAEMLNTDIELFGGCYIERIPRNNGKGYNSYHVCFNRVRTNDNNSQFFYKKDWQNPYKYRDCEKEYPAFYDGINEPSIVFYKEYRAEKKAYPLPSYVGAMNDIESSIETSKHTLTNAKTGFSAGKLITFYTGEDENKKRSIDRRITNAYSGAEGKKFMLAFTNEPSKKPTVEDLGQSDLSKENITPIQTIITQNILSGHGVTHGLLFGIQQEGKLGGATELRTAYSIFNNNYIKRKQIALERLVSVLGGFDAKIVLSDPIELDINPLDFKDILPKEWVFEKLGIDPSKYGIAPTVTPLTTDVQQAAVNSVLTNLTAKQHQQISRIVRQFGKEQLTKEQATLMLKNGFGFTDDDVSAYLGIDNDPLTADAQFSANYNEVDVAMMFEECGQSEQDFSVIKSQYFNGDDSDEFTFQFAAVAELTELEKKISDLLKVDKLLTNEAIAKALNVTIEQVNTIVGKLVNDGIIATESVGGGIVRKVISDVPKSALPDIQVMYKYEKRDEASGADLLPTSRPFCVRMLTRNKGKLYSRQDIQKISERLGYSVFNRAGGFWNNNGKVDTQCRHGWFRKVVIKKK